MDCTKNPLYTGLMVHLQRHKFFQYIISSYGRKIFKAYFNMHHSDAQKHVSYKKKKGVNSTNILHTGLHKSFLIHYWLLWEKNLKLILIYLYCTKHIVVLTLEHKGCQGELNEKGTFST